MMPCEGPVRSSRQFLSPGADDSGRGGHFGVRQAIRRIATPATGFNFHLLVKDLSRRPSPRHRQKALDSFLKQMENKVRT